MIFFNLMLPNNNNMGNVSSTTSNSLSLVASATYNVAKIATEYIYNLVVTPIVKVAETSVKVVNKVAETSVKVVNKVAEKSVKVVTNIPQTSVAIVKKVYRVYFDPENDNRNGWSELIEAVPRGIFTYTACYGFYTGVVFSYEAGLPIFISILSTIWTTVVGMVAGSPFLLLVPEIRREMAGARSIHYSSDNRSELEKLNDRIRYNNEVYIPQVTRNINQEMYNRSMNSFYERRWQINNSY